MHSTLTEKVDTFFRVHMWLVLQMLVHGHAQTYYRFLAEALRRAQCRTYLDVGCGAGFIVNYIRSVTPIVSYLGVDTDPRRISYAQLRFGQCPECTFAAGRIEDMAMTESYECLLLVGLLHHIPDRDCLQVIRHVSPHVTRKVIVLEPVFDRSSLVTRLYRQRIEEGKHTRVQAELIDVLNRAGLQVDASFLYPQFLRLFDFWVGVASFRQGARHGTEPADTEKQGVQE